VSIGKNLLNTRQKVFTLYPLMDIIMMWQFQSRSVYGVAMSGILNNPECQKGVLIQNVAALIGINQSGKELKNNGGRPPNLMKRR